MRIRQLARHLLVGWVAFAPIYAAAAWLLRLLFLDHPVRGALLWRWGARGTAVAMAAVTVGALASLWAARRRLGAWRAITLGRTALLGALAAGLAAAAWQWLFPWLPALVAPDALRDVARTDAERAALEHALHVAGYLALGLQVATGAVAVGLLYAPWLMSAPDAAARDVPAPADA